MLFGIEKQENISALHTPIFLLKTLDNLNARLNQAFLRSFIADTQKAILFLYCSTFCC